MHIFHSIEAIALLKNKSPGTFVVRDSQSYEGAFGLAVKVDSPPIGILQHAGQDLCKCFYFLCLNLVLYIHTANPHIGPPWNRPPCKNP